MAIDNSIEAKITSMDFSLINDMDNNNTHSLCQTWRSNRSFDLFLSLSVGTPSKEGRSLLPFFQKKCSESPPRFDWVTRLQVSSAGPAG